ncbi:hypothetical protein HGRIS_005353 [Hohenbuehelia grisea]|uniref:NAD(P)-binding protein n=1 Tax=Hohenbuehelia grisea TaxID=104357 RepID=A0ABR3JFI3_9AGAR
MVNLATLKASHAAQPLISPVAVFIGGTNGLGAGMAIVTARYSKNPTIHIVGRSQAGAGNVLTEMKAVNPDGKYEFHQCDVSLLANVRACADTISAVLPKINYLVLSTGIFSIAGRTETAEGIDFKMVIHYYSRMLFIERLLPNVEAAAASGRKTYVINIFDALRGDYRRLIWDDLDLKTHFSLRNADVHCSSMMDVAVQRYARLHSSVPFMHTFPWMVATGIARGAPWYIKGPLAILQAFGAPPQEVGEYVFEAMMQDTPGAHFIDNKGREMKKLDSNEEVQEKVWSHTLAMIAL